jgi:hypothetical protein
MWTDPLIHGKQQKRDTRVGMWNVRDLYMSDLLKTVARELTKYTFDFVRIQEVCWEKGQSLNKHWIIFSSSG